MKCLCLAYLIDQSTVVPTALSWYWSNSVLVLCCISQCKICIPPHPPVFLRIWLQLQISYTLGVPGLAENFIDNTFCEFYNAFPRPLHILQSLTILLIWLLNFVYLKINIIWLVLFFSTEQMMIENWNLENIS